MGTCARRLGGCPHEATGDIGYCTCDDSVATRCNARCGAGFPTTGQAMPPTGLSPARSPAGYAHAPETIGMHSTTTDRNRFIVHSRHPEPSEARAGPVSDRCQPARSRPGHVTGDAEGMHARESPWLGFSVACALPCGAQPAPIRTTAPTGCRSAVYGVGYRTRQTLLREHVTRRPSGNVTVPSTSQSLFHLPS